MRQFITEGVTLALLGGLTALPIVVFAMSSLQHVLAGVSAVVAIDPDFSVDRRVIAAALLMSVAAGVVAGLAPALQAGRRDLNGSLRNGSRGSAGDSGRRIRTGLVVAQVALSLTLLVSGGLFLRSLHHAREADLGFKPEGMFLASASPGIQGYDAAQRLAFYRRVRDQVAALPGIENAAWTSVVPMAIISEMASVAPDVHPSDPGWRPPVAFEFAVSPQYFATAGVQILEGRGFIESDDESTTRVVIINEPLAHQFWPNDSPFGRRLTVDDVTLEVVGVVRGGKYLNVGETPRAAVFTPLAQAVPSMATLAVRSSRPPSELAATIRGTMRQIDPDVAVYDVRAMATHLENGTGFFVFRLGAFMTGLFGGMGMLLASVGLYGMIAYHVGQRTQEIGVRMALGANASDIIRDVLARGGRSAVIGIAIGIVLSAGIAQLLKGLLLGISPFDPVTYAGVAGLLIAICLIASFLPARRATMVDPLVALRAD
jgi:predicted permease